MYFPVLSGIPNRTSEATIVAWTSVDPPAMSIPIQQQISALEPELPVYNALTMDQILDKTTTSQAMDENPGARRHNKPVGANLQNDQGQGKPAVPSSLIKIFLAKGLR